MTGFRLACGACKFLRRKCCNGCVFAPYFCYDEAASHFAAVHKVFGASNVSKLLLNLPVHNRHEAAASISYEALARMWDPIYGCVAHIFALEQQVAALQEEIEFLEAHLSNHATDAVSSQISQVMTDTDSGFQFPSQLGTMDVHDYCTKQPPEPSHAVSSNLILTNDMNAQLLPFCTQGDQSFLFDSTNEPNFLGGLPVMDQSSFCCDPLLDNAMFSEF